LPAPITTAYTTAQVQSLNVGVPLLQRNATPGKFTLTIGVKKTAVLRQQPFADFPTAGPETGVFINGAGKLEFEFPSPGNAAFFRLESQQAKLFPDLSRRKRSTQRPCPVTGNEKDFRRPVVFNSFVAERHNRIATK
jgi:hypothetical protein